MKKQEAINKVAEVSWIVANGALYGVSHTLLCTAFILERFAALLRFTGHWAIEKTPWNRWEIGLKRRVNTEAEDVEVPPGRIAQGSEAEAQPADEPNIGNLLAAELQAQQPRSTAKVGDSGEGNFSS